MTMQTSDIICIEGDEFLLQAGIFEPFFKLYPERRPKSNTIISSNWRKYIAYLKIQNNELYVHKMIVRKTRFDFFSGFIMLYYYQSKEYWYAEWKRFSYKFYSSEQPNKFKLLQFNSGRFVESRTFNLKELTEFKKKQFNKFKKTKDYKNLLNRRLLMYDDLEDSITGFTKEMFDDGVCQRIISCTKEFL